MRRIIFWMSVSLDGYMEGPNREIDWHRVDAELHVHLNEDLGTMSAFLEGRVTYELMDAYWPTADADPAAPPEIVQFARIWRATPKIVYSRTLQEAGENATIVREVVPAEVEALKAEAGGDMVVGGADIGAEFARHDLVDEYRIYVHPVLIGRGKRAFAVADTRVPLRLAQTRAFGSGVVMLRYERGAPAH